MQVNGVDLSKVDKVHLARVAAQLGAKAPPGATAQRLVEEVGKIFDRTPQSLAGPCDNCGGMSDQALSECPFCGVGEDDEVMTNGHAPKAAESQADVHMAELVESTQALSLVGPAQAAAVGERKLDEAMARITALKDAASGNLWLLGREIKGIYDQQLWLQRTNEGKAAYKSFDAFVHSEITGMSKTTSYWLMDIAEAFTEQEVRLYGRTKLGMVLKAPKEDRALLLDKVKGGITKRALAEDVDKARTAKGEFVRETNRSTDTKGRSTTASKAAQGKKVQKAKESPPKKRGDTITIAKILGRQQVKLWCNPGKRGAEPEKRARKFTDKPYGVLDLENGVQMQFALGATSAGDWFLTVLTDRP